MRAANLFIVSFLLLFPLSAGAIPAINCHCFTDRSYDPAHPGLADPYFLAAAQNSFLAAAFNIDKKTVVMKKQQGTSSDDFWVAYWIASQSGTSADTLLKAKQSKETWKDAIAPAGVTPKAVGAAFFDAMVSRAPASVLAEKVVDTLLVRHHFIGEAELIALRKAGATNQEAVLASYISTKTRQPPLKIFSKVKNGSETWGKILTDARIDVAGMQKDMPAMLNPRR